MATISVGGIGSGLDVNGILEQLVAAERLPTENRLNFKEATLQAELSAFGSIKSAVSTFQSSLSNLKSASSFTTTGVNVGDTDVLTATTTSVAQEGSYSVETQSLAQAHSLASIAFDKLDETIGSGTLTFSFGETDYDPGTSFIANDDTYTNFEKNTERSSESIVIDSSNNTVTGIRDAINEKDIGVSASIVDDGAGYRLLLTSTQQGLDNSLEISVDEGTGGTNTNTEGLSLLAFNENATNVEQTQAAQDAKITVNGLTLFRESNSLTGAIPGVTLNIKKLGTTQVNVTNTSNTQAQANISIFVNSFNDLTTTFNSLTKFGGENEENGILLGDTTSKNVLQQIRRENGNAINNGGTFNSLASIGITTQRDGTLSLDAKKLSDAFTDDFDSVARLFYDSGNASDSNVSFSNSSSSTQEGNYQVSISKLATQGKLVGEPVSGPITINASNDSFSLNVDGNSTGTITINSGLYTDMDTLASEIENRINQQGSQSASVSVSYSGGAFQISSSSYGSASTVTVATSNSSLKFTVDAVSSSGANVVGSIGGLPAIGNGQQLVGSGKAAGLELTVRGNTIGSRGDITFSKGLAAKLDSVLSEFLGKDGQVTAKTDSINKQIKDIEEQRLDLSVRVASVEARYRKQFTALDVLMGQLNTTSSFLQQQLDSLPGVAFNQN